VSVGCKCRPISIKQNVKIEANVVVSKCTVCYRVLLINFYVIIFYTLFGGGVVLTPKTPR